MKFSFVICTYNRAQSLTRCIESLCLQIYPSDDYEIVIINNNSTDNTTFVCDEFLISYPNHIIRSFVEEEQGISYARNRGVKEATGKFILFIDDDETIRENHLKLLAQYLKEYPYAELVASAVIPVYEAEVPKWMSPFTERLIGGTFEATCNEVKILNKKQYPGTGHTIVKRSLFDKYGLYNTSLGRKADGLLGAEDKDMAFRWIENKVKCYFFPNIPIYHHIAAYKLTDTFFNKLTFSVGVSERIRTLLISKSAYYKRIMMELVKWAGSIVLFLLYLFKAEPSKGNKLIVFRWNVSKGLLSTTQR